MNIQITKHDVARMGASWLNYMWNGKTELALLVTFNYIIKNTRYLTAPFGFGSITFAAANTVNGLPFTGSHRAYQSVSH